MPRRAARDTSSPASGPHPGTPGAEWQGRGQKGDADPAGSPTTGGPVYLAVGLLRRPHGVHGDILMELYTDFPERLNPGTRLYIGKSHRPLVIARRRDHKDGLLIGFREFNSPEAVGALRNAIAYVPAADRPALPEGSYYHHQLLGLAVVTEKGESLGHLTEIMWTGANDVYVVTDASGRELLVPAAPQVLLGIDLKARTIRVRLPEGLLDDEGESPDD